MRCLHGLAFTFLFLQNVFSQDSDDAGTESSLNDITASFASANIVPDLIPTFRPTALVDIHYTLAGEEFVVIPGETLPTALTDNSPTFSLTFNDTESTPSGSYVVLLLNPNGPVPENSTRPSQVLHFLQGDYTVDTSDGSLDSRSQPLAKYTKPSQSKEDDTHPFVVLVYNQPQRFADDAQNRLDSMDRESFNFTGFARALNFTSPIAGNYFFLQPSEGPATSARSSSTSAPRPSLTAHIPSLTPLIGQGHKALPGLGPLFGACLAATLGLLL